jgi:serine/threonine-protein kinase
MSDANPSTLSRYRIVSRLDGWSIGETFQAFDPLLERHVIVEFFGLDGVSADDAGTIKTVFYREMQRVGTLAHANVARLFDAGETADGLFATWEHVEGTRLDRTLAGAEPIDAAAGLRWLKQTAAAIEAAHLKGILHLSLNPSSVLIDTAGDVKVIGFGLSPVVDLLSRVKGYEWSRSPYEAPERQVAGPGTMKADWFSFGAIAREVSRALPGEVPAGVSVELDKMMAAEPEGRTPSALPLLVILEGGLRARGLLAAGESDEKAADSVTAVFNSIIEADRTPRPSPPADSRSGHEAGAQVSAAAPVVRPEPPKAARRRPSRSGPWIALVAALLVVGVAAVMFAIWAGSPMLSQFRSLTATPDEPAAGESVAAIASPPPPAMGVENVPPTPEAQPLPPAQAPASAGAAGSTGVLRILTQPAGAAVTVDGEARGVSPLRVEGLALGQHSVSASLSGHSVVRQTVELTRETRSRAITLSLAPVTAPMGVLSVSTTPSGAAVTLDGRPVGSTPARLDVSAGRHVLRVEQAGYAPLTRELDVKAGQREALELALEPVPVAAPVASRGPIAFEQVEVKPRQVEGPENPAFPPVARLARQSGTVVLRWTVDERGGVTDIEVVQSTAKVFETSVLGWIRDVKFEPGQHAGKPVPVAMSRRFRFELAR